MYARGELLGSRRPNFYIYDKKILSQDAGRSTQNNYAKANSRECPAAQNSLPNSESNQA